MSSLTRHARARSPARGQASWLALSLAVLAIGSARADVAPPRIERPADVDLALVSMELSLTLHDLATAPRCRPDQYRWPGCSEYPERGYVNSYQPGDPLVYAFAPAGIYDVTLQLSAREGQPAPRTVTRRALKIGARASDEVFVLPADGRPGRRLRIRFSAREPGRADRELCEARGSYSTSCSSEQPQVRCWIDTPDGAHHEASSCKEEYVYRSLMELLCERRVRMKESAYARLFRCAPVAAATDPGPTRSRRGPGGL